jgi:predicted Rossmann fold nucleotide-binding protein DprA/Smf involved in DNA uptake
MKLAVIGSRKFTNEALLRHHLDELRPQLEAIVSGGARGADQMAERWAKDHGIETVIFLPDYDKFGRSAPLQRNHLIVAESDAVLAFLEGESRGTRYTIKVAEKANKPVTIVD